MKWCIGLACTGVLLVLLGLALNHDLLTKLGGGVLAWVCFCWPLFRP